MQQIDNALNDLTITEALDPTYYFPKNARRAASKIREAAPLLGKIGTPARQKAEALAIAVEEYADAIRTFIAKDAIRKRSTDADPNR